MTPHKSVDKIGGLLYSFFIMPFKSHYTAAWTFVNLSQYILGIIPDFDGLIIDPCITPEIKSFKVERMFRGKRFIISADNSAGVEKA